MGKVTGLKRQKDSLKTILSDVLKKFCIEGKSRFTLNEYVEEANVTTQQAEDFFVPLLKKGEFEGKIEIRCPFCGKDVGLYDRVSQVPEQIECEICNHNFSKSVEYFEIVLEVKEKFFRDQKYTPNFNNKNS